MKRNLTPTDNFHIFDEILTQQAIVPLSLNPQKTVATSFAEIGILINEETRDIQLITSLRNTLERILQAQMHNFPENIFWDCDFMVSSMLRQALVADEGAVSFLNSFSDKMVSLMDLFGSDREIRFRYVHDFLYGFEWAKWVKKQPDTRANAEPFSLTFLDYLLNRGQEILQLIDCGDTQYHQLSEKVYRNPFCFSREPEDERRLLVYLAAEELIPVKTWNWNAHPVWNKPFHQLREHVSLTLDIPQIN